MKSNYLVIPFFDDVKKTSLYSKQGYNTSLSSKFKIYTEFDRLLPFVCEINSLMVSCDFEVIVRDWNGEVCGRISQSQIKHKIYTKNGKRFIVYGGENIPCLVLGDCKLPYSIQIGNFHSEWFWVTNETSSLLKIELGNETDFNQIPYSLGFKQHFFIESTIGTPDVDSFSITSRDARGNTQTTYQRLVETYNFYLLNVPPHVKNVISSMEVLDSIIIEQSGQTLFSEEKQAKVKSKRNELGFDFYDVEFSVVNKEIEEIGVCEVSKFVGTNCDTEIASELNCVPINAISEIDVNCNIDNLIEDVIINCDSDCKEETVLFFATVTYS
jgi:hypothetical protein